MRLPLAVSAVLLGLTAASLPASATPSTTVDYRSSSVVRGDLGRALGPASSWALRAADRYFDASGLRVEQVRESIVGTHVRGRQFRDGVPVAHTDWLVSAVNGRIVQVEVHPSRLPGRAANHPVAPGVARAAALARLGVASLVVPPVVDRVLAPRTGRLVDVYRVSVVAGRPAEAAVVEVAAATGRVLGVGSDARYVDGSAMVFDPNPIVTKRDGSLREPYEPGKVAVVPATPDPDLDSPALSAQRRKLPLRELDDAALTTGRLVGPWVNVLAPGYNVSVNRGVFDVARSDPRFEGLMAYAHLDRVQRYLQSLGFRGRAAVNAEPQDVLATRIEGYDNSMYQPRNDLLVFGAGGVDDAEDAEVILHEYGHAMQDAQVPGYGGTEEALAMGEGFGDFLAGAYFARTSGGFGDVCLMEWDATSYRTGPQTCLRRMDSAKVYPKNIVHEEHADGEIWSTFLWNLRAALPGNAVGKSDNALRLVVTMHEFLTPRASFRDAVAGLRTAATALKHPEWAKPINAAAKKRGLPLGS